MEINLANDMPIFIKVELVLGNTILINVNNIQHIVQASTPKGEAIIGVSEILIYKNDGTQPAYQVKTPLAEIDKMLRPAGGKLELMQ